MFACVPASAPAPESTARSSSAGEPVAPNPPIASEPTRVPATAVETSVGAALAVETVLKSSARIIAPGATSGLVAFANQVSDDALAWVGPLGGNGGRDVLIYVPPGARPGRDFQFVYHFHGTHSETVAAQQPGMTKKQWVGWDRVQQTVEAITALQAKGGLNVALVYPLSAGKRPEPTHTGWFNKEYDRMWMRGDAPGHAESFDALHEQVRGVLQRELGAGPSTLGRRVLAEGHSAGGIALRNIARGGTSLVEEYLFLDASFAGWADGCHRAVREHGADALVSVVITAGGIADPFGRSDPWCETTPKAAAAWPGARGECESSAKRTAAAARTCAAQREAAELWPEQREWCEAFAADMRGFPGVYLLRTRITHGKQPRHFAGGLELPADRGGAR